MLAGLADLELLDLEDCGLTDAGVKHLESLDKLQNLTLKLNVGVTDAAVPSLIKLRDLKTLDVAQTTLSDAGLQQLRQALPNCQIVR